MTFINCVHLFLDWLSGIQVIEALVDFMVVHDAGQRLPGREKYERVMSTLTEVKLNIRNTIGLTFSGLCVCVCFVWFN